MRRVQDGDFPFANEWNAVARAALTGTCVVSGCAVSADGSSMDLAVDGGTVAIDGAEQDVTAQSVTVPTADPDDPRYDTVVVDGTGSPVVTQGDPSPTPQAADFADGEVVLAIVRVGSGASALSSNDVFDARAVWDTYSDAELDRHIADFQTLDSEFTDHVGKSEVHHSPPTPGNQLTETAGGDFDVIEGAGSGLDADTVDGQHANDIANDRERGLWYFNL
jgi:hypothetical protein